MRTNRHCLVAKKVYDIEVLFNVLQTVCLIPSMWKYIHTYLASLTSRIYSNETLKLYITYDTVKSIIRKILKQCFHKLFSNSVLTVIND
ncbi:unnamed protein product, partial [Cylicocyclus nassatus]